MTLIVRLHSAVSRAEGINMTALMLAGHENEVTGSQSLGTTQMQTGPARDCRAESMRTNDMKVLLKEQFRIITSKGR